MNASLESDASGGALPLTAVALPALVLALALSLLFARIFAVRYQLWQTADLVALAAARMVSEQSLWSGRPSLDQAAARAAALSVLRDHGLSSAGADVQFELELMEGRVIRARKAAPEVRVRLCRQTPLPFASLAGRGRDNPFVCAEARAAVLRPKRLLPME